jgi:hypothetical protein
MHGGGECIEAHEKEERVHRHLHDAERFGTPDKKQCSMNEGVGA